MNIPNFSDNFASVLEEMQRMTPQDVMQKMTEKMWADYDKYIKESQQ